MSDEMKKAQYENDKVVNGFIVGKASLRISSSSRAGRPSKQASLRMKKQLGIAEIMTIKWI